MGCDIHLFIEHTTSPAGSDSVWWDALGSEFRLPRIYNYFALLAGVRNYNDLTPVSKPRGVPERMSQGAGDSFWCYISEGKSEDDVAPEQAAAWVASGSSFYREDKKFVSNPDYHSHSWLTPDEFEKALTGRKQDKLDAEYAAVLAAMRSLESSGKTVRCVFWFDN